MVKKYFVKNIAYNKEGERNEEVFVAKKENEYMFLITSKFKFLGVKNYVGLGISYDPWCKSMGCGLQKLMFPYEWLDNYEKLSHVGPVSYEDFYSNLKSSNITRYEYEMIVPQWVIGCGYITLQTLFLLLRLLRRWPSSTISIRLMYAKTQLVSQTYQ